MRFHGNTAIRCFLLSFAGLIAASSAVAGDAKNADLVIRHFPQENGTQYSALAVRPSQLATQPVRRHIVVVDTSASQIGTARQSSLALVSDVLSQLAKTDAVRLYAIDVQCEPLTQGFVAVGSSELRAAIDGLSLRTPLGTTDLANALTAVVADANGQPTSVLYIGDGMSSNRISLNELAKFAGELQTKNVAFHAVVLGPKTGHELPNILANLTGGIVNNVNHGKETPAGATVAAALAIAPVEVTRLLLDRTPVKSAGNKSIMVRPDRHTIVLTEQAIPQFRTLTAVTADDKAFTIAGHQAQRIVAGAELRHLTAWAKESNGINVPTVDLPQLVAAGEQFAGSMEQSVEAAEFLAARGRVLEATRIAQAAARMDDSNPQLRKILISLPQPPAADEKPAFPNFDDPAPQPAEADEAATAESVISPALEVPDTPNTNPGNDGFGGAPGADLSELDEAARKIQLQSQLLKAETDAAIDQANRLSAEDPDYATNTLKDVLETIQTSQNISPDVRSELLRRVSNALSGIETAREVMALRQKQIAQDEAIAQSIQRRLEDVDIEEQRLAIQIEKIRGLLDRARHGDRNAYEDAEFESRVTLDLKPGSGPATQALVMSEALGQLDKAYRLVNLRADRFLETLYQVELSHVPFPDEPPVQYPPADVWRALSLTRIPRYESSDLRTEAPVEKWLRQMLDKPVRNLDFQGGVPLSEILETISTYFTATYGTGAGELGTDFQMSFETDRGELGIVGIDTLEDVIISDISYDGMTLRNALKLIFAQTQDDQKSLAPEPLTYVIQNEVIMITTVAKAESEDNLVTRVYPVADLVYAPSLHNMLGGGGLGGGQGGGLGGQGGGLGGQGGGQGGFGGGGGQGGFGGGGGGGFQSIPPEVLHAVDNVKKNGITTDAVKDVKKKPILKLK